MPTETPNGVSVGFFWRIRYAGRDRCNTATTEVGILLDLMRPVEKVDLTAASVAYSRADVVGFRHPRRMARLRVPRIERALSWMGRDNQLAGSENPR